MDLSEPETLQIRVDGLNVRQFVDPEFLELLEKKFNIIKAINLTLIVDNEDKDMITISHPFVPLEEENKTVIDVNEPETLNKILEILKDYRE